MADLIVDIDALNKAITQYNSLAYQMEKLEKLMNSEINTVKNDEWNTPAGKAFFDNYDNEWAESLKLYVDVLRQLADSLNDVKKQYYQPLVDKAKNLSM